jgi:predicted ArsR family transcriptional regulator
MAENKTRLEALADPVRLAIVRRLARSGEGQSLAELSQAARVHPNTARGHLAALVAARVVEREHLPGEGRGRPSIRYRLVPNWALPVTELRELAGLLAAIVLRDAHSNAERREVARGWGRHLAGAPGRRQYAGVLRRVLEGLGVDAALSGHTLRLTACPCPLVAPDHPELVCDLLTGAADGVLETCGAGVRIGTCVHDPAHRACHAELRPASAA